MHGTNNVGGTKHDQGKPPMDLIPWEAMEAVARVLEHGKQKYSAHNWRNGFAWSRLAAACLRHLFAWLSGQDKDPESGESHIAHALCCLMFLMAHISSGLGTDDRYKRPGASDAAIKTAGEAIREILAPSKRWYVDRAPDAPRGANCTVDAPHGTFWTPGYETEEEARRIARYRSVPRFWVVVQR